MTCLTYFNRDDQIYQHKILKDHCLKKYLEDLKHVYLFLGIKNVFNIFITTQYFYLLNKYTTPNL